MYHTDSHTGTAQLPPERIREIQTALDPYINNQNERPALLFRAFGDGSPILRLIDTSGTAMRFAPHLISVLWNYGTVEGTGTNALAILLRTVAEQAGIDKAATLRDLADSVEQHARSLKQAGSLASASAPFVDRLPKPNRSRPLIFLCHGKEDKAYARLLYRRLVKDGFYPWLDEAELRPGQNWKREIAAAIARSERFIVCISSRTTGARFWQREITNALTIAEQRGLETGYILPVRWDECEIPERLASLHATALFPCDAQRLNEQGYELLRDTLRETRSPKTTNVPKQPKPAAPRNPDSLKTAELPKVLKRHPRKAISAVVVCIIVPIVFISNQHYANRILLKNFLSLFQPREPAIGTQILILSGHTRYVFSASFSPDGKRIVTASADKTARVWDIRETEGLAITGKVITTLRGHSGEVNSASFSPDGTRIVTASDDKTARVWDIRETEGLAITGKVITTLSGHTDWVRSASFSPDGKRIMTASADKTARVWDIRETEGLATTGKVITTLSGHTNYVYSASFSPDGTRIVTASDDKTARVWDIHETEGLAITGKVITTLRGHTDLVWSASFSPDGTRIVTASDDKTARVWWVGS